MELEERTSVALLIRQGVLSRMSDSKGRPRKTQRIVRRPATAFAHLRKRMAQRAVRDVRGVSRRKPHDK